MVVRPAVVLEGVCEGLLLKSLRKRCVAPFSIGSSANMESTLQKRIGIVL